MRRLAPDLLAAGFAVEARVVAGAIQGLVGGVVVERKALVRADGREADDVAVGADPARHALAELEQHARRVRVGIGDVERLVGFEIADIAEPVGRIVDPRRCRRGFGLAGNIVADRRSRGGKTSTA